MQRLVRFFRVLLHNVKRLTRPPTRRRQHLSFVSQNDLDQAHAVAERNRLAITEALIELNLVGEREQQQHRAQELGLPYVDLDRIHVGEEERTLIPLEILERLKLVPVKMVERVLWVASARYDDLAAMDTVREITGCRIMPVLTTAEQVETTLAAWRRTSP